MSGVAGGASFTGGSTAGTSITGGTGIDILTGGAGPDVIIGGDGNDTITGLQGADTLTGGAGNDTFVIGTNSAVVGTAQVSGATLTDTITDFTTGQDKLSLTQATSFLGNFANFTAGSAATSGSGVGANQAFYSVADNTVYVLATAGTLAATDTMVRLSNAPAALAAGDLNFGTGGNTITLNAVTNVTTGTAATNTTTFNDIINTTMAFLATSTIDGGVGSGDTINITDAATTLTFVLTGTPASTEARIAGIEIINLNLGSTGTVTIPTLTTQNLVVNNAHASNPSTVVLGAQTAQTLPLVTGTQSFVSVSTGIDTVTAGATGQSISTGGGDDVVNIGSQAIFFGGTYNGGAGTNDVLNVTLAATQPISFAAAAVAGGAAVATGFEVINVAQNNAASTVTIVPDAAVTVNFTDAAAGEITVTGTGGAVTANAAAGQQLTVNGTGNVTVGATNTTGTIIFSATKTAGTNSVTAYGGNQTVTNNSAIVTTINGALLAGNTEALSGAGPFTVNGLVGTGTISAGTATGVITVNGTTAGARTITTGSAADVVTITGTGTAIQTINAGAGNDTVTLTTTAGANVVDLGAGNDTYTAGTAGGSVTGGTGSDSMTGGAGVDVFIYASTLDSSGVNTDTITGLNFNADVIRITSALTGTFDASTTTATTNGYANFNATTGLISVKTEEGSMSVTTASATNAPAVTGSLQTSSVIEYVLTMNDSGVTATTGSGNDTVTGGAGADVISTGAGIDVIRPGVGQDTITSGAGADTITIVAGEASGTIGGAGNSGTIVGFDVITDLATGTTAANKDTINLPGAAARATTATTAVNGTDSTLTIGGVAVAQHTISATGLFVPLLTDGTTATNPTTDAGLAAVIQYLAANDIGDVGATVVFTATYAASTRGSVTHSFIYSQTATTAGGIGGYSLVDVVGVTLVGVESTASTTDLSALIA